MNIARHSLPILQTLIALLTLPLTAAAEICTLEIDSPALLTVEAESEIALAPTDRTAVVLEASPTHLVIAASRSEILWLESSTGCDLRIDVTRAEIHQRMVAAGLKAPAMITTFYSLGIATKEEDHDIDPDPDNPQQDGPSTSLLTLIHLDRAIPTKEEDHDIDPDPDFQSPGGDRRIDFLPTKEEDHDIDADPDQPLAGDWARDWSAAANLVHQLGPGWYFTIRGGEVKQEILVENR